MNVVDKPVETVNNPSGNPSGAPKGPPPPLLLSTGCIVTLRMRGHTRTNGQEYFAPAVVLNQYDDQFGSIEALVWDYTAGTHYQSSYAIRELSSRGHGVEQEVYESRSNIGAVLFSPDEFARIGQSVEMLEIEIRNLLARVSVLESVLKADKQPAPAVAAPTVAATQTDTKNAKRSE